MAAAAHSAVTDSSAAKAASRSAVSTTGVQPWSRAPGGAAGTVAAGSAQYACAAAPVRRATAHPSAKSEESNSSRVTGEPSTNPHNRHRPPGWLRRGGRSAGPTTSAARCPSALVGHPAATCSASWAQRSPALPAENTRAERSLPSKTRRQPSWPPVGNHAESRRPPQAPAAQDVRSRSPHPTPVTIVRRLPDRQTAASRRSAAARSRRNARSDQLPEV